MSELKTLHRQAMDIAEEAFRAKRLAAGGAPVSLFRQALEFESQAAALLPAVTKYEPTRSILYQSAASLAVQAGDRDAAERLAASGLSGFPPADIKCELYAILDAISFERHLEVRGVELSPLSLRLVLAGAEVGEGEVPAGQLAPRIDAVQTMCLRTAERKLGLPWRHAGAARKQVKGRFEIYATTVAEAASYALTLRLGGPSGQLDLPFGQTPATVTVADVIRDVVLGVHLVAQDEQDELKELIPDDDYLVNFVGLARELAPDGRALNLVGLTALQNGKQLEATLRRPQTSIRLPPRRVPLQAGDRPLERKQLEGILGRANSLGSTEWGTVIIAKSREVRSGTSVKVPASLMHDVVQKHYEERVRVTVTRQGPDLVLEDFERIEDDE